MSFLAEITYVYLLWRVYYEINKPIKENKFTLFGAKQSV